MKFKKSNFIYTFSDNNKFYIVQTYTKKMFQVDYETYKKMQNDSNEIDLIDPDTISAFKKAQIIDSLISVENLEVQCKCKDNDDAWHSLHIIPTASCNFGCDYCFVLKDKEHRECDGIIHDDILYKGIDFFFKDNQSENVIVTFYGGEPLLAPDVIYKSVNYIENTLGKRISKKIITNGTLVTPEIAEYLAEHEFDVNVSLDGGREAQNAFRKYKDGSSSYDDVVDGIETLKKYGNSIRILVTVGDFNASDLEKNVREILKLHPTTIALNLPKALQKSDNKIEQSMKFSELLTEYLKCIDLCYEQKIPEGHMADIIFGFLRDEVQYRPCHGCGKQIALTPNGMIGPCQAYLGTKKYFLPMSDFRNKTELRKSTVFSKWSKITMYNCTKCRECYLLPVCPGDCPYDWENRSGSLMDVPDTYCRSRKMMFDYMVKRIANGHSILFRDSENE